MKNEKDWAVSWISMISMILNPPHIENPLTLKKNNLDFVYGYVQIADILKEKKVRGF